MCNQGSREGRAELQVVLSQDSLVTPDRFPYSGGDTRLSGAHTNLLAPGACQALTLPANASAPEDGTYYLGAAVDPLDQEYEFFEDNNTRAGSRIGVGYRPDFVVSALVGPASVTPDQPFQATVRVCNTGTQAQSPGMVELYASEDTVLTPSSPGWSSPDHFLGGVYFDTLTPGQCVSTPAPLSGLPEGAWYLAASVDPMNNTQEFIEDDNTRVGPRIGVGTKPDFVVRNALAPSSVQVGQPFSAYALVCNQGTVSGSTQVELYLSEDTVLTPHLPYAPPSPDFLLGSVPVDNLTAGECRMVSLHTNAGGVPVGTYKVGAIVNRYALPYEELIYDNNTRVIWTVNVTP